MSIRGDGGPEGPLRRATVLATPNGIPAEAFICTEGRSRAPVAIGGRPPSKASAIDVCRQPALNENLHILKETFSAKRIVLAFETAIFSRIGPSTPLQGHDDHETRILKNPRSVPVEIREK
ncbi:hypothetical protein GEV33_000275 [Tenebrio molitor]|uniref:Uncharacterized protein n=1 Tax=Tenebrio molitor TaxID=7067 RepID=A0A8J6LR37_TENMO|nr:hypothetical protein GEV33_000275 [Tenebrio molitor]